MDKSQKLVGRATLMIEPFEDKSRPVLLEDGGRLEGMEACLYRLEKYAAEGGVSNEILRVAQRLVPSDDEPLGRAVVLLSAKPREGKTTLMFHLAHAVSSVLDKRVLYTDLHRKPLGDDELELRDNVIEPTLVNNLDWMDLYLPYNQEHKFMQENLQQFRENYRLIFVEAPAFEGNPTPDPVVLSTLFDQVLVVFRHRRTSLELVQELVDTLKEQEVSGVTVLLNQAEDEVAQTNFWKQMWQISSYLLRLVVGKGKETLERRKNSS